MPATAGIQVDRDFRSRTWFTSAILERGHSRAQPQRLLTLRQFTSFAMKGRRPVGSTADFVLI